MKGRQATYRTLCGYCLAEALLVISLICICFGIGYATFPSSLSRQEARALSLTTQASVAWTQMGVLWRGGVGVVSYDGTGLDVTASSLSELGGDLSGLTGVVAVSANVSRWSTVDGFVLRFLDPFAAPDSGGSLYFEADGGAYKVTIRPESGLSIRRWVER